MNTQAYFKKGFTEIQVVAVKDENETQTDKMSSHVWVSGWSFPACI